MSEINKQDCGDEMRKMDHQNENYWQENKVDDESSHITDRRYENWSIAVSPTDEKKSQSLPSSRSSQPNRPATHHLVELQSICPPDRQKLMPIPATSHEGEVATSKTHNQEMREMNSRYDKGWQENRDEEDKKSSRITARRYENWSISASSTNKKESPSLLPSLSPQPKRPATHDLVELQPIGQAHTQKNIPPVSYGSEAATSEIHIQPHDDKARKTDDHQYENISKCWQKNEDDRKSSQTSARPKYENWSIAANPTDKKPRKKPPSFIPSQSSHPKRPATHHLVDVQPNRPALVEYKITKCAAYHNVRLISDD